MKHLSELLERLEACKSAYQSSKSSLDNSLEYIVRKEELRVARFDWLSACEQFVLEEVLNNA